VVFQDGFILYEVSKISNSNGHINKKGWQSVSKAETNKSPNERQQKHKPIILYNLNNSKDTRGYTKMSAAESKKKKLGYDTWG